MVSGGVIAIEEGFEPLHHVERAYRSSECRTPLILVAEDGDPFTSICAIAKSRGCAVWHIDMSDQKNEQNALDYVEVGTQNGDWVYLTGNERASQDVLRKIAVSLVTMQPEPKHFPRRELFRVWLLVEKPIDINDHIRPIFPQLMTQNAIYTRARAPPGCGNDSPEKMVRRLPQDPPLFVCALRKHDERRRAGRDSDSESDAEEPEKKATGLWFHRTVDFHTAAETSTLTKASEEIYKAIEQDDPEAVERLALSGQVDIARVKQHGLTPLMFAVSRERVAAAKVLLAAGADANMRRESDDCPPLFMSLECEELVQALIDAGADYYARFEGYPLENHPLTAPNIAAMIRDLKGYDDETKKRIEAQKVNGASHGDKESPNGPPST